MRGFSSLNRLRIHSVLRNKKCENLAFSLEISKSSFFLTFIRTHNSTSFLVPSIVTMNEEGKTDEPTVSVDPLRNLSNAVEVLTDIIPRLLLQGEFSNDDWTQLMGDNALGPIFPNNPFANR